MSACQKTAKRIIKCFCNCSELTEDEVQRIYRLGCQGTLIDRTASKMLRRFLELQRNGDKTEAEQNQDIYEACDNYMLDEVSILTLDELDELCELGLPYYLERELKKQIKTGDRSNIERCLLRIQGECRCKIEVSNEYKMYKQAILDKMRNVA